MIKKKGEHGGMCVMSGRMGCGLCCICLYFAMFTIIERLCVLAVQIIGKDNLKRTNCIIGSYLCTLDF